MIIATVAPDAMRASCGPCRKPRASFSSTITNPCQTADRLDLHSKGISVAHVDQLVHAIG
jgi:hypothetical protein